MPFPITPGTETPGTPSEASLPHTPAPFVEVLLPLGDAVNPQPERVPATMPFEQRRSELPESPRADADDYLLRKLRRMTIENAIAEMKRTIAERSNTDTPRMRRLQDIIDNDDYLEPDDVVFLVNAYQHTKQFRAVWESAQGPDAKLAKLYADDPRGVPADADLLKIAVQMHNIHHTTRELTVEDLQEFLGREGNSDRADFDVLREHGLLPDYDSEIDQAAVRFMEAIDDLIAAADLTGQEWRSWTESATDRPAIHDMVHDYLRKGTSLGDAAVEELRTVDKQEIETRLRDVLQGAADDDVTIVVDSVLSDLDELLGVGKRYQIEVGGETRELHVQVRLKNFRRAEEQDGQKARTLVDTTAMSHANAPESKTVSASTTMSVPLNGVVAGAAPVGLRFGLGARDISRTNTTSYTVIQDNQARPTHVGVGAARVDADATYRFHLLTPESSGLITSDRPDGDADPGDVSATVTLAIPEYSLDTGFKGKEDDRGLNPRTLPKVMVPDSAETVELWKLIERALPAGLLKVGTKSRKILLDTLEQRTVKSSFPMYVHGVRVPKLKDEVTGKWHPSFVIKASADTFVDGRRTSSPMLRGTLWGNRGLQHEASASSPLGVGVFAGGRWENKVTLVMGADTTTRRRQRSLSGGIGGRLRTILYMGPSVVRAYAVRWKLDFGSGNEADNQESTGTDTVHARVATDTMHEEPGVRTELAADHWMLRDQIGDGALVDLDGLEEVQQKIQRMLDSSGLAVYGKSSNEAIAGIRRLVEAQLTHKELQTMLSEPGVYSLVDSLFGRGVEMTFRRRGWASTERVSVNVKAHRRSGRRTGVSRTVSFQQGDLAIERAGAELSHARSAAVHGMAGYAKGMFGTFATIGPSMRLAWQRARGFGVIPQRAVVGLTTGEFASIDGSKVSSYEYEFDIDYEIQVSSHIRPRAWVRALTLGFISEASRLPVRKRFFGDGRRHVGGEIRLVDEDGQIRRGYYMPREKDGAHLRRRLRRRSSTVSTSTVSTSTVPASAVPTSTVPASAVPASASAVATSAVPMPAVSRAESSWVRGRTAKVWVAKSWTDAMAVTKHRTSPRGPVKVIKTATPTPRLPAVADPANPGRDNDFARAELLASLLPARLHFSEVNELEELHKQSIDLMQSAGFGHMVLPGSETRGQLDTFFSPEFQRGQMPLLMPHGKASGTMVWSNVFTNDEADLRVSFEPTAFEQPSVLGEMEAEHGVIGALGLTASSSRSWDLSARLVAFGREIRGMAYAGGEFFLGGRMSWIRSLLNQFSGGVERNLVEEGPEVAYRVDGNFRLTLTTRTVGSGDIGASASRSHTWLVPASRDIILMMQLSDARATKTRIDNARRGPEGSTLPEFPLPPENAGHHSAFGVNKSSVEEGWYPPSYLARGTGRNNLGPGLIDFLGNTGPVVADLRRQLADRGIDVLPDNPLLDPMDNGVRTPAFLSRQGIAAFIDNALTNGAKLHLFRRRRLPLTLGIVKSTTGHDVHVGLELSGIEARKVVGFEGKHEYIASARSRLFRVFGKRMGFEMGSGVAVGALPALAPRSDEAVKNDPKGRANQMGSTGIVPTVAFDNQLEKTKGKVKFDIRERWHIPRGPMVEFAGTARIVLSVPSVLVNGVPVTARSGQLPIDFRIPELDARASKAPPAPPTPGQVELLATDQLTPEAVARWQAAGGHTLPDRAAVITFAGSDVAEQAALRAMRAHHDAHSAWWNRWLGEHPVDGPRSLAKPMVSALVSPEMSKSRYRDALGAGISADSMGAGPVWTYPSKIHRYARLTKPRLVRAFVDFEHEAQEQHGDGVTRTVNHHTGANAGMSARSGGFEHGWVHTVAGVPATTGGSSATGTTNTNTKSRVANIKHKKGLSYVFAFDVEERYVVSSSGGDVGTKVTISDPVEVSVPGVVLDQQPDSWLDLPGNREAAAAWEAVLDQRTRWLAAAKKAWVARQHATGAHDESPPSLEEDESPPSLEELDEAHAVEEDNYLERKRAAEKISDALLAGTWQAGSDRPSEVSRSSGTDRILLDVIAEEPEAELERTTRDGGASEWVPPSRPDAGRPGTGSWARAPLPSTMEYSPAGEFAPPVRPRGADLPEVELDSRAAGRGLFGQELPGPSADGGLGLLIGPEAGSDVSAGAHAPDADPRSERSPDSAGVLAELPRIVLDSDGGREAGADPEPQVAEAKEDGAFAAAGRPGPVVSAVRAPEAGAGVPQEAGSSVADARRRYPWLGRVAKQLEAWVAEQLEAWGVRPGGLKNCVMAAMLTDMSWLDGNSYLPPAGEEGLRELVLYARHVSGDESAGFREVPGGIDEVTAAVAGAGPGARAVVGFPRGDGVLHMVNVFNDGGEVVYLDGQASSYAVLPSSEVPVVVLALTELPLTGPMLPDDVVEQMRAQGPEPAPSSAGRDPGPRRWTEDVAAGRLAPGAALEDWKRMSGLSAVKPRSLMLSGIDSRIYYYLTSVQKMWNAPDGDADPEHLRGMDEFMESADLRARIHGDVREWMEGKRDAGTGGRVSGRADAMRWLSRSVESLHVAAARRMRSKIAPVSGDEFYTSVTVMSLPPIVGRGGATTSDVDARVGQGNDRSASDDLMIRLDELRDRLSGLHSRNLLGMQRTQSGTLDRSNLGVVTLPEGSFTRDGAPYSEADRETFLFFVQRYSRLYPDLLIVPGTMLWAGETPDGRPTLNHSAVAVLNGRVVHEVHQQHMSEEFVAKSDAVVDPWGIPLADTGAEHATQRFAAGHAARGGMGSTAFAVGPTLYTLELSRDHGEGRARADLEQGRVPQIHGAERDVADVRIVLSDGAGSAAPQLPGLAIINGRPEPATPDQAGPQGGARRLVVRPARDGGPPTEERSSASNHREAVFDTYVLPDSAVLRPDPLTLAGNERPGPRSPQNDPPPYTETPTREARERLRRSATEAVAAAQTTGREAVLVTAQRPARSALAARVRSEWASRLGDRRPSSGMARISSALDAYLNRFVSLNMTAALAVAAARDVAFDPRHFEDLMGLRVMLVRAIGSWAASVRGTGGGVDGAVGEHVDDVRWLRRTVDDLHARTARQLRAAAARPGGDERQYPSIRPVSLPPVGDAAGVPLQGRSRRVDTANPLGSYRDINDRLVGTSLHNDDLLVRLRVLERDASHVATLFPVEDGPPPLGVVTLPGGSFTKAGAPHTEADWETFLLYVQRISRHHPNTLMVPGTMVWAGETPDGRATLNHSAVALLNGRIVHEVHQRHLSEELAASARAMVDPLGIPLTEADAGDAAQRLAAGHEMRRVDDAPVGSTAFTAGGRLFTLEFAHDHGEGRAQEDLRQGRVPQIDGELRDVADVRIILATDGGPAVPQLPGYSIINSGGLAARTQGHLDPSEGARRVVGHPSRNGGPPRQMRSSASIYREAVFPSYELPDSPVPSTNRPLKHLITAPSYPAASPPSYPAASPPPYAAAVRRGSDAPRRVDTASPQRYTFPPFTLVIEEGQLLPTASALIAPPQDSDSGGGHAGTPRAGVPQEAGSSVADARRRYPWLGRVAKQLEAWVAEQLEAWGVRPGGLKNCVMAAMLTDMSWLDGNSYLPPAGEEGLRELVLYARHVSGDESAGFREVPGGIDEVTAAVAGAGPGARAVVGFPRGDGVLHMVNVFNDGGEVVYLDGQASSYAVLPSSEVPVVVLALTELPLTGPMLPDDVVEQMRAQGPEREAVPPMDTPAETGTSPAGGPGTVLGWAEDAARGRLNPHEAVAAWNRMSALSGTRGRSFALNDVGSRAFAYLLAVVPFRNFMTLVEHRAELLREIEAWAAKKRGAGAGDRVSERADAVRWLHRSVENLHIWAARRMRAAIEPSRSNESYTSVMVMSLPPLADREAGERDRPGAAHGEAREARTSRSRGTAELLMRLDGLRAHLDTLEERRAGLGDRSTLAVVTLPEGSFTREGPPYTEADWENFRFLVQDYSRLYPDALIVPGTMVWAGESPDGRPTLNHSTVAVLNGRLVHEVHQLHPSAAPLDSARAMVDPLGVPLTEAGAGDAWQRLQAGHALRRTRETEAGTTAFAVGRTVFTLELSRDHTAGRAESDLRQGRAPQIGDQPRDAADVRIILSNDGSRSVPRLPGLTIINDGRLNPRNPAEDGGRGGALRSVVRPSSGGAPPSVERSEASAHREAVFDTYALPQAVVEVSGGLEEVGRAMVAAGPGARAVLEFAQPEDVPHVFDVVADSQQRVHLQARAGSLAVAPSPGVRLYLTPLTDVRVAGRMLSADEVRQRRSRAPGPDIGAARAPRRQAVHDVAQGPARAALAADIQDEWLRRSGSGHRSSELVKVGTALDGYLREAVSSGNVQALMGLRRELRSAIEHWVRLKRGTHTGVADVASARADAVRWLSQAVDRLHTRLVRQRRAAEVQPSGGEGRYTSIVPVSLPPVVDPEGGALAPGDGTRTRYEQITSQLVFNGSRLFDDQLYIRLQVLREEIAQESDLLQERRDPSLLGVVTAPEGYFRTRDGVPHTAADWENFLYLVQEYSRDSPDVLIVPGTVMWAGESPDGRPTLNHSSVAVLNGRIVHEVHQLDVSGELVAGARATVDPLGTLLTEARAGDAAQRLLEGHALRRTGREPVGATAFAVGRMLFTLELSHDHDGGRAQRELREGRGQVGGRARDAADVRIILSNDGGRPMPPGPGLVIMNDAQVNQPIPGRNNSWVGARRSVGRPSSDGAPPAEQDSGTHVHSGVRFATYAVPTPVVADEPTVRSEENAAPPGPDLAGPDRPQPSTPVHTTSPEPGTGRQSEPRSQRGFPLSARSVVPGAGSRRPRPSLSTLRPEATPDALSSPSTDGPHGGAADGLPSRGPVHPDAAPPGRP
ncbi:hypothetical protein Cci01nite_82390 [Catellatospora citrea]|uniref:Tox-PL domain-containing protein n=1 Tax=Catellatospora citrea TaxID=53366 RepID=A0A8J3P678_9ACTN|nr:hypothetical protein Cci01nite_82390 [Catellatospora citrea]